MKNSQELNENIEDSFFDLALLGLLEIEGQALLWESQHLAQDKYELHAKVKNTVRRHLRWQETTNSFRSASLRLTPIFTRVAVIFFTIFLGFSSVFIVSAEARQVLYKALYTYTGRYAIMEFSEGYLVEFHDPSVFQEANFSLAPTYIPDGFSITNSQTTKNSILVEYRQGEDFLIAFYQSTNIDHSGLRIDTENASNIETVMIGDSEALFVEKDGRCQISWQIGKVYLYIKANITKEEVIKIAYGIKSI